MTTATVPVKYDTKAAALYLGVATTTLEGWRTNGGGPTFYKPGRYVFYLQPDLDAWIQTRRFASTAQVAAAQ